MLSLTDREWATFAISDLFRLETGKGKGLNHLNQTTRNDGISYLGATNRNNGVLCFVEREDGMVQRGNCIAFIRNGEGSIGYSVYKAEDFIASSDLTIGYAERLNRQIGIFVTTIADTVRGKYSFNYKRSDARLAKEMLQLPVDEAGNPDWAFMEEYIRERESMLIAQYRALLTNIAAVHAMLSLTDREWKEFALSKIFSLELSKGDNQEKLLPDGSFPLVSAGFNNNGIVKFIAKGDGISEMFPANTITVDMFGKPFYQPFEYYAVSHGRVNVLRVRDDVPNDALLFVSTCIEQQKAIYSYNHMASSARLDKQKIMLPATDNGAPDWAFMKDYVSMIRGRQIRAYLEYLERRDM